MSKLKELIAESKKKNEADMNIIQEFMAEHIQDTTDFRDMLIACATWAGVEAESGGEEGGAVAASEAAKLERISGELERIAKLL